MILSGVPHTIVGVARLPVGYPGDQEIIIRMAPGLDELVEGMRGARYLDVVARVDPAYEVAEASAEMNRIVTALGERFANHRGWGGVAVVLSDELLRPYRGVLALLLAAGGVFLLLAVVNVTGLVAARTVEGRKDRSVRLALGASEGRLLRGSAIESVLIGSLAGGLALIFAYAMLDGVLALVPLAVPRVANVHVSLGIGGGIMILAVSSGCIVGFLGYLMSRGAGPSVGRSATSGESALAGRRILVASQVALTTLLATTGAGIVRNMATLRAVDMGFRAEGVASSQISVVGERYPSPESRLTYWRDLLDRLEARGLDAALGTNPPMAGVNMPWGYRVDEISEQAFAQYHIVSPNYFEVMDVNVVEGRVFDAGDREGAEAVVVINETLADERFSGESAVGRVIYVVGRPKTIIGVVHGTRHRGPGEDIPEELYAPYGQDPWPYAQLLVRGDAGDVGPAVAQLLDELDPALGVPPMAPYTRFVSEWYSGLRLQLIIVGVLAVVGMALATLGIYALVAYRVSARRREIGVRMALGASGARMFSEVVRQSVTLAAVGMIVGFAAWYASLPLATEWLGDVAVRDPWVPVSVAAVVGLVAVVASALPARQTVSVDPAVTLRTE